MRIGIIGANSLEEMDFSFVREEVYDLIDVPCEFYEDLYLKLGVSRTVIGYWRKINYKPPCYYLFWLFYKNRCEFRYEEYRKLRDDLISKVCLENERIGKALKAYADNEDESYDNFIHSDGKHMYFLSDDYGDGSGDTLLASVNYHEISDRMNKEVMDNKGGSFEIEYSISKHPVILSDDSNQIVGIDMEADFGYAYFDSEGVLKYLTLLKGFKYESMEAMDLLEPYIFMPHPFKKGDIVKYDYYGEKYGVLYYAGDDDKRIDADSRFYLDGSDFITTRITFYKNDNSIGYKQGHDHICPLYYDMVEEDEELEGDLRSILLASSRILKTEEDSMTKIDEYLDRYYKSKHNL